MIKREKITWPGARIKKKGEGLPQHEQNTIVGDLYVTIDVDFPKGEVTDEQRECKTKEFQIDSLTIVFFFSNFSGEKSSPTRIETSSIQRTLVD